MVSYLLDKSRYCCGQENVIFEIDPVGVGLLALNVFLSNLSRQVITFFHEFDFFEELNYSLEKI
jgi:hypothetical protein